MCAGGACGTVRAACACAEQKPKPLLERAEVLVPEVAEGSGEQVSCDPHDKLAPGAATQRLPAKRHQILSAYAWECSAHRSAYLGICEGMTGQ